MRQLIKIAVMGLACLFSLSVCAQADNNTNTNANASSMTPKPMMKKKRALSFSDMTPEQQQKVKQIVDNMRLDMKQTMDDLRKGRQGMSQFIMGNQFDDAKAQAYAASQGKYYAKMMYLRMKTRYQIYQVMTPEQKAEIQKRMQEMQMKRQNKMNGNKLGQ